MTKIEFLNKLANEKPNIGVYQIETEVSSEASFILGCYFDSQNKEWIIYETDERGLKSIVFRAEDEEKAYDKLYKLVSIQQRLHN
ncbi:hypothetical protein GE107_06740 [Cohnella sp. CFH 77786]|uniref:hypothetical protein n=1 Tax=Cohnella sp. CFH 77786 TaxID=2662265 RepID=UPI001C608AAD|nr:hypothetical protein [Cohnella sp. CFH 77786]MBW5445762.1 hypothetical protein [Cohnella sp. CFH 77786]